MFVFTNELKTTKETSNRWYKRNKKKKEEREIQNALALKSGGEIKSN